MAPGDGISLRILLGVRPGPLQAAAGASKLASAIEAAVAQSDRPPPPARRASP